MKLPSLALILAVACGLFIRATDVANTSIWLDEAWSIWFASSRSLWHVVVDSFSTDFHPPVYYAVLHVWGLIAGYAGEISRWPSVIMGTAAIVTTWLMVGAILDRRAAEYAAWMMAVSPVSYYFSLEARMYALLIACLPLLIWALVVGRTKTACASYAIIAYSHALSGLLAAPFVVMFAGKRKLLLMLVVLLPWLSRLYTISSDDGKVLDQISAAKFADLIVWIFTFGQRPW